MKQINHIDKAGEIMALIKKGAFLTVRVGETLNTMTIGWATMGFVWSKPIFMVAVRLSRYTFGIIEKAGDFTVTVPTTDMQDAVMFCGTKSGRDYDKFRECGLETVNAVKTFSPIIKTPGIHLECKIVFKSAMNPALLDPAYDKKLYPEKDYHTLYFGEILDCYEI